MPKIRMKKVTKTTATVSFTLYQNVEIDVNELVRIYGPKARTKKFLIDYAVGNRGCKKIEAAWSSDSMIIDTEFSTEVETTEVPYYE